MCAKFCKYQTKTEGEVAIWRKFDEIQTATYTINYLLQAKLGPPPIQKSPKEIMGRHIFRQEVRWPSTQQTNTSKTQKKKRNNFDYEIRWRYQSGDWL